MDADKIVSIEMDRAFYAAIRIPPGEGRNDLSEITGVRGKARYEYGRDHRCEMLRFCYRKLQKQKEL